MPKRERAMLNGQIVTVIERKRHPKKNPSVTIRDGFGWTKNVRANDLTPIEDTDPLATFDYAEE